MIARGACNFDLFAVNDLAYGFHHVGGTPTETRELDFRAEKNNDLYLVRAEKDDVTWGWCVDIDSVEMARPELFCVRNTTTDAVIYAWECEHWDSTQNPLISHVTDRRGGVSSNLPDGTHISRILFPFDLLSSIQTDIENATLPAWVSGSKYEWATSCTELIQYMWHDEIMKRKMKVYATIDKVNRTDGMNFWLSSLYHLLYFRCASAILFNYSNPYTMIPLLVNQCQVASTGELMYTAIS